MPLTTAERLLRLPHGAQRDVARELGMSKSYISTVMRGEVRAKTEPARKRLRRAEVALARRLRLPVDEVFPKTEEEAPPLRAVAS